MKYNVDSLIMSLEANPHQLILAKICRALKIARLGIEINRHRALKGSAMEAALLQLEKDVEGILGDDKYNGTVFSSQRDRYT